jgi:lysophospholipase L1-like esterase
MKYIGGFIITLGLLLPTQSQAQQQQPKRYLMAAMGDSITAGFLAATSLDWFNSTTQDYQNDIDAFMENLAENIGQNPFTSNMDGDMAHIFESRSTLSWATGKLIPSQYMLVKAKILETEPTAKVSAYNIAVSGGVTQDLLNEVDGITAKMNTGHYDALKYVTLLIGNNDVCQNLDQTTMRNNLHETFRRLSLIKQSEPIRVLMSGIPRINDVGAPAVQGSHTLFNMTCGQLRNEITKTCLPMAQWSTADQYAALTQLIQATNELLSDAADDANKSFKNLNVVFSNRLFDETIAPTDLAVDCFHPNANTQARISQGLWNDQPWYK